MNIEQKLVLLWGWVSIPVLGFAQEEFRAGAAAVDVTPERLPLSMTGSFQDRMALRVQDPLHARALVLDDGEIRVAVVVVDSCLVSREIFDEAKRAASEKTGIPAGRMMMSATHTHTAPTAVPLAQVSPDPAYVEQLTAGIAESVVRANAALEPAAIGWGSGEEPGEVSNRRWHVKAGHIPENPFGKTDDKVRTNAPRGSDILVKPAGPVDPEVAIVSVNDAGGKPLSLLANYGLHYVGGVPPFELSADYFGEFDRRIRRKLGAGEEFVGILGNGASGDINNYDFRNPRPRAEPMERIGAVAEKVAAVAAETREAVDHGSAVKLRMVEAALGLGVRKPGREDLDRARKRLAAAENPDKLNIPEVYAQETVRIADYPDTVSILLQVLKIGDDCAIVAIPCEVFAEIGLEIKRISPYETTFVLALANGYHGYLPTPKQHDLGGYETWRSGWSYLEKEASVKIVESVRGMLSEVAVAAKSEK